MSTMQQSFPSVIDRRPNSNNSMHFSIAKPKPFYSALIVTFIILHQFTLPASGLLPFDYHRNLLKVEKSTQFLECVEDHKSSHNQNQKDFLTNLVSIFSHSWLESEQLKFHYIKDVMRAFPNTLEAGLEDWRESWIPEAPTPSISAFQSLETNALDFIMKNLSSFAAVFQQVHQDIILHEPSVDHKFKRLRNRNHLILCRIQTHTQIRVDRKILAKLLDQKLIDMNSRSERNRRVYLILRDYSRFLNFSLELLMYKISNLPSNTFD